MTTEQDLIKQAQQGDADAFERLYELFYKPVYTYIFYRVGQRPLAEDLTSDVFERMVTKIDTWRPINGENGKPFIAWLYTIAGNLVRNHIKRDKHFEWLPLDERDSDDGESVMAQIGNLLQKEQLAKALLELTEDQRQIIFLRFINGQPIATVAQIVGKTETSIKALQRRALIALRKALKTEGVHV
ncbi:MAG: RNA polymerase sigma-70 factor (ECF subfamily) [Cellvibrionaceae bacterium]|jgi:RNA polymerase sigma-70 factor (ECF subfamily)